MMDTLSVAKRTHSGILLGLSGLAANSLLVLGKCLIALATNSVAIMADGLNNLADAASSLVTLAAFKLSAKSADQRHPYGYGRMEYICGLLISCLIMLTGFQLLKTVLSRIGQPEPLYTSGWTIPILLIAIVMKLLLAGLGAYINRSMTSATVKACVLDNLLDAAATGIILLSTLLSPYTALPLDTLLGLALVLLIFRSGLSAAKDNLDLLLGEGPDRALTEQIHAIVRSCDGLYGLHNLEIHDYGPARQSVTMHVKVRGNLNLSAAHTLLEELQQKLQQQLQIDATIHLDLDEADSAPQGGAIQRV